MDRISRRLWAAVMFGGLIGLGGPAVAAERTAPVILKELDAIKAPSYDPSRLSDPGYREKVQQQLVDVAARRDALILELYHADPENDQLPPLMQERWRRNPPIGPNEAKFATEVADVLAKTHNPKLKSEAYFARAQAGLLKSRQTGKLDLTGVEQFLANDPKDPRGALLLYMGTFVTDDEKAKEALQDRILKDYPDSQVVGDIRSARRQRDSIGKPFELEFTDAISGSKVSIASLKGKVVVLDFWATWCGPCVAEMPHMKDLYARYHKQGVEFIGVSLDQPKEQGGLDSLKDFVKKNQVPWPQFYEGKPSAREFAQSWGINLIPTLFVVDAQGKLFSVQAREKLDEMIPELLGLGKGKPSAAGKATAGGE